MRIPLSSLSKARQFITLLGLALLLSGFSADLKAGTKASSTQAGPRQPNIVILFADDLGYGDLGSYGHPYNRTPNLDTLAREGQRWTDFYVAAPVCSPSRGALMTGKLPNRSGLYGRQLYVLHPNDSAGMPERELTMAEALKAQGYRTALIGKWHLGDAPDKLPTRHGFDYWFGLPYSNDMEWVEHMTLEEMLALAAAGNNKAIKQEIASRYPKYRDPKVEYWNVPLLRSSHTDDGYSDELVERPADQRTLTRRYTEEAQRFIREAGEQPFLLYLPYNMPHTPLFRSAEFDGRSLGGRYGDVIEEIDWSVGEIRRVLEQQGLQKNTLVFFSSDNGPWLAMQHHAGNAGLLSNGKGTTFEGGMRVPGIFWWPGTIEPAVVHDIGSTLDVFTTALSLAGAPPVASIDGMDLSATLGTGASSPRDSIAYYRSGELQAFRKGLYKIRLISEGAYGLPPKRTIHETPQLFHLGQDPGERFDIAAEQPEVLVELQAALAVHEAEMESREPIFDSRLKSLPTN
ncbi:MAG: arylsulfatase A [Halieaceae bacterium]|jgi:arylsulfatase A